jgi:hypothetical protein
MRANVFEQLIAFLREHPCVDCGERDIRVLQFDHVDPRTKSADVSKLLRNSTWSRVIREIEKCVVRCGNCHRRKTILERRSSRDDLGGISEDRGSWLGGALWRIIDARAVSSVDRAARF